MTHRRIIKLLAGLAACAVLLPAGTASARKVGNPGPVSATVTDGSIKVGSKTFDFNDPITFTGGTVQGNGTVTFPPNDNYFPPVSLDAGSPVGTVTVRIRVPQLPAANGGGPGIGIKGTVNPLDGTMNLTLPVWIKIDGLGDCHIASATSPVIVNPLTTGTSGALTGTPYNPSTGNTRLVNSGFSVPGSQDCTYGGFINVDGEVNSTVGIPSSNTTADFNMQLSPVLTKGINATFTATPNSGTIPLTVSFNPAGSTAAAGVRQCTIPLPTSPNCGYRWDFNGDGTDDQVTNSATTVTFPYTTPGTYHPRLRIYDVDQDFDETTRTVTVNAPPPDLAIDKSHTGDFLAATTGAHSYTLSVSNHGTGATQGTTTVVDTLPSGVTFNGFTGTGWNCSAVGQVVTCTRSATINAGATAPAITLTVNVAGTTAASVTNTATVSSVATTSPELPTTLADNTDTDPTTVKKVDMRLVKSHDHDFDTGTVETYHLDVDNLGTTATTGTTTVTDTLPGGITFQSANAPAGWTCGASGQTVTCTHAAAIAPGPSERINLNVVAGATTVGTPPNGGVTNLASVSTPNDANTANNSSSDPTTVVATVDLTIDKSHSSAFRVGSSGTYTIAVQNRGARTTAGTTTVHDTLPNGLVPTTASGSGWNCVINLQDVDCTSTDPLGASANAELITIDVDVTAAADRPSVTNTATVSTSGTGDDADANPGNDSDSDPTSITLTDLTIDKSHVGGFPLGGQGTYTLSVRNDGTAPTVGTTTVTDTLPAELSYVSASGSGWSCGATGQDVTCTRSSSIGAGQTAPPIALVVDVADTTAVQTTNSASVSAADDINPDNNSDTDPTPLTAEDLQITKSHSGDFRVGTSRAYVIRVKNVGSQPATGTTTVTDNLPAGLSYVNGTGSGWNCGAASQVVTCTRSTTIASGAEVPSITVQVQVANGAYPSITNTAEVSNAGDRNDANDTASDPTTITAPNLALSKSHLGSLEANSRASYVIAVQNVGTAASGAPAVVTDTLPAGLTYAGSPSNDWDCSHIGQAVTCEHSGSIPAGESAESLELRVDIAPSVGSQVTNEATVALAADPVSDNDTDDDTAAVGRVDVSIDKSHTGNFPRGGDGSYTLAVSNGGTSATRGTTTVTDALPSGLSFQSASGTGWSCSVSSGTVSCDHAGTIAPGGAAQPITLNVHVSPAAAATVTNTASVSTPGDAAGPNSDSDPTSTDAVQDVSSTINAQVPSGGAFRVGGDASYDVAVRNAGEANVNGPVNAVVTLADGLTYTGFTGAGWSCVPSGGQSVLCSHAADMPVGNRSDFGVEATVAKSAAPSATSTVSVGSPMDAAGANNDDSDTTPVKMIDLSIAMQHAGTFGVGSQSTFTINVENVGSAGTIAPIRVFDTLPAGLTFVSGAGPNWTCGTAGADVICSRSLSLAPGAQADPLTLTVTPQASIGSQTVANQATVSTRDDADTSNNSATETVTVGPNAPPPLPQQGVKGKVCKKKPKKHSAAAAKKKCKKKGKK
jgi:uncharacterized repeat protein (TIGR01451 family)